MRQRSAGKAGVQKIVARGVANRYLLDREIYRAGKKLLAGVVVVGYSQCMKLEEIVREASKLPEEERASLASRLLRGLESPIYAATDEEVFERMEEAENDPSVWLTFDQLVAGINRRGR